MINNSKKSVWYNNSKLEKLIKPGEEIPFGFIKGRLPRPKKVDLLSDKISKKDLYKFYIIENHSFNETFEYFNINRSDLRILISFYNIKKDPKQARKNSKYRRTHEESIEIGKKSGETQKKNWENKSNLEKKKWSNKQKTAHNTKHFKSLISQINIDYQKNLNEEIKKERNSKRSNTLKQICANNKKEIREKQNSTRKKNRELNKNNFCRSIAEQKIYDSLIKLYPDLVYDEIINYDKYPYYVDFYIPSLDLYIELNAHPSHGKIPYDEENEESLLESYSMYGDWLKTYVERDVDKLKQAKINNLNYIRIYPYTTLEKNKEINNFKFNDITTICYEACNQT